VKCDFCSELNPTWKYLCISFKLDGIPASSQDDWSACDACHDLIEKDAWQKLAERCYSTFPPWIKSQMPSTDALSYFLHLHKQFQEHRLKEAPRRLEATKV